MIANFYDIESLQNVWTLCNFRPEKDLIDIYYICDDTALMDDKAARAANLGDSVADAILRIIHEKNKNFTGSIRLFDLRTESANRHLAAKFGLSDSRMVNNPNLPDSYQAFDPNFRPVCDTDRSAEGCPCDYDPEKHPFLMGYNSYNYDTTMLAYYLSLVFHVAQPVKVDKYEKGQTRPQVSYIQPPANMAAILRDFNDSLFLGKFKANMSSRLWYSPTAGRASSARKSANAATNWSGPDYNTPAARIRKNMLFSGRHVDVARLNEKAQKIALKRILGMLGAQILESDKLRPGQNVIENTEQFIDLLAYNASDCVNLKYHVFDHKLYRGQFDLKSGLLKTYPELVYERDKTKTHHEPDISVKTVRRDRLYVDSSSAQLATKALCPYEHLTDIPAVSFMYPSEGMIEQMQKEGKTPPPRVDILDETLKFMQAKFAGQPHVIEQFMKVYNYYANIRGKNFNSSENYRQDYHISPDQPCGQSLSDIPDADLCMPYYHQDGTPSTAYVTFSTGGIHGAEYNKALYDHDVAAYERAMDILRQAQAVYPNPIDLHLAKSVEVFDPDTGGKIKIPSKSLLTSKSTKNFAEYRSYERPKLFEDNKLVNKYTYTSADETNHEDFTSYYPNLLRMMYAFWNNGLGYDRYAEIFDNKQYYGVLMKAKTLTAEQDEKFHHLRVATELALDGLNISSDERDRYSVLREGTKLILNSASGAADANFESNIRMNNQIISMRIIGQLFSFRIGQAQTIEGAKITSTNTDGLFSVMEESRNAVILEREAKDIGVEIEPEPTYLISKDTNNRIEMEAYKGAAGKIQASSGGTAGCRRGPTPAKALNHPAIIDWALVEYMVRAAHKSEPDTAVDLTFNPKVGMDILLSARQAFDRRTLANMYQNVLASSIGSITYIFGYTETPADPIIMQHYNRVFIMKDNTPNTVHLQSAAARKVTPLMLKKRRSNGERDQIHDPDALNILNRNGVMTDEIPPAHDATIKKVTNLEPEWFIRVDNRDLDYIPDDELEELLNDLDYGKYLKLLGDCFEGSWRNLLPGGTPKVKDKAMTTICEEYFAGLDPACMPALNPDRAAPIVQTGDPAAATVTYCVLCADIEDTKTACRTANAVQSPAPCQNPQAAAMPAQQPETRRPEWERPVQQKPPLSVADIFGMANKPAEQPVKRLSVADIFGTRPNIPAPPAAPAAQPAKPTPAVETAAKIETQPPCGGQDPVCAKPNVPDCPDQNKDRASELQPGTDIAETLGQNTADPATINEVARAIPQPFVPTAKDGANADILASLFQKQRAERPVRYSDKEQTIELREWAARQIDMLQRIRAEYAIGAAAGANSEICARGIEAIEKLLQDLQ